MTALGIIGLAYLAGLGTYWGWIIAETHIGRRYRSWSK